jgi:hypothetical protein
VAFLSERFTESHQESNALRQHLVVLLVAVHAVVAGRVVQAAPITYTFTPEAAVGGDFGDTYAMTGSVTTDGTIGPILEANILSWSYTVSINGVPTATEHAGAATAQVVMYDGQAVATATTLTLAYPNQPDYQDYTGPQITFSEGTNANYYSLNFGTQEYESLSPIQYYWQTFESLSHSTLQSSATAHFQVLTTSVLPTEPFVFATAAPEPSSIALLAIGAIGLAALARRRAGIW